MPFTDLCRLMTPVLAGPSRSEIVERAAEEPRLVGALARIADALGTDTLRPARGAVRLGKLMRHYDALTRADGFHVLHEWDPGAPGPHDEAVPVNVLRYVSMLRKNDATDRRVLAIVLDYYFLHVLALMAVRIWDDGDANAHLDRLSELVAHLQGPQGSGHRFVADAETLLLVATSRFEREPRGYALLLDRVRTLQPVHQVRMALSHGAALGCHLRFGYEAAYARSAHLMRDDNAPDYPWLRWSVLTLLEPFVAGVEEPARSVVVESLLGALAADPSHVMGDPEVAAAIGPHRSALGDACEPFRPGPAAYSPLSFFFNFSHSVVRGAVVDAMLWGEPWPVTLNDLLSSRIDVPAGAAPLEKRVALATTLMDYARKNPHRVRGKATPWIVYDPVTGRQVFNEAVQSLR